MIVAAGTPNRESEKDRGGGFGTIRHIVDAKLFVDNAALGAGAVVAVEGGSDFLGEGGVGEEISGELLDGELVKGHVVVEGIDDPIAPAPHVAGTVGLVAVGVGVAGGFEPADGHALGVAG